MSNLIVNSNLPKRFLSELLLICSNNKQIEKVILFGSRARGDFRFNSDIDLAFYSSNLTHSEQNHIEFFIHEIPTHLKIDVLFMDRLGKKDLVNKIKRDGVILYEQGEAFRKA